MMEPLPPGWGALTVFPVPRHRRRLQRLVAATAVTLAAITWAIYSR
jgi:hypothetical protein